MQAPLSQRPEEVSEKVAKPPEDADPTVISENCWDFPLNPVSHGGLSWAQCIQYWVVTVKFLCATTSEGLHTSLLKEKHLSLIHVSRRKPSQYLILIDYVTLFHAKKSSSSYAWFTAVDKTYTSFRGNAVERCRGSRRFPVTCGLKHF